jgi:glucose-6-phosphate isomerase
LNQESANLGAYQSRVDEALISLSKNRVIQRIWEHDYTVWKQDPTEISNRLGWLHTAEVMLENLTRIEELVKGVQAAGYTHVYLLGMGGSSIAPKVFSKTFGTRIGYLELTVIDSTDPDFILEHSKRIDPAKTLFIVSTKSGTTEETLSFFKFFYNQVASVVGNQKAGEHFVAITDPGTKLTRLAGQYHFRATFLNDPNIGGRYSALSFFGLVPAALIGVDLVRLLKETTAVASSCRSSNGMKENPGAWLGTILGELAKSGRDKVTFVVSDKIASFADWAEQLIAETTGKEGCGIVPVVDEPLGPPEAYGKDRLFIYLRLEGDTKYEAELLTLEKSGQPIVRIRFLDLYDIGRQSFLWEMAVAIAGHIIGINPFDQPNVEMAKALARQMVANYVEKGVLVTEKKLLESDRISVYGTIKASTAGEALTNFLKQPEHGAYLGFHAYVNPATENYRALQTLRVRLRKRTELATTVGYGPSFLHSTGQLHKGDAGHGLFLQFTSEHQQDAPIPDEAGSASSMVSFGTLETAQALGDYKALVSLGRKVIRFHFDRNVADGLNELSKAIE